MSFLQKRIIPAPDTVVQQVGKDLVLLNLATEDYYGLNVVGANFWQLISENKSVADAIDALLLKYNVERDQIEADIERLLIELNNGKLIVVSDD